MKVNPLSFLPLAAVASAIVVPDEHVFAQIPLEKPEKHSFWDKLPSLDKWAGKVKQPFRHVAESVPHSMDSLIEKAQPRCKHEKEQSAHDVTSWIQRELNKAEEPHPPHGPPSDHPHPPPPHHGPPGRSHPPHRGSPPHKRPGKRPHKKPWWRRPHHHHKHHAPNQTIYELISGSKYTTNLTKFIDDNKDIRDKLNSTKANYTIFAPTDWAFARFHKSVEDVPKEIVTKVLLYHILPDVYSSFKLIWGHTAPTLLDSPALGGHPQRVQVGWYGFLAGLRVNLYDKIIVPNIPATNGLIHATAAILGPPPRALALVKGLPTELSTFELGLVRTDLYDTLNTTGKDTVGGTLFAPTNTAFKRLGVRANAFLFSEYGKKYLKALLEYHVVPERTLYSTAFYDGKKKSTKNFFAESAPSRHQCMKGANKDVHAATYVHVDLPTLLGKPVAVDIIRRGPFVEIKLNAFVRVALQDVLAKDGVIHLVNSVIIPPRKPGAASKNEADYWNGEGEIEVEDLKERLKPFVEADGKSRQDDRLDL